MIGVIAPLTKDQVCFSLIASFLCITGFVFTRCFASQYKWLAKLEEVMSGVVQGVGGFTHKE